MNWLGSTGVENLVDGTAKWTNTLCPLLLPAITWHTLDTNAGKIEHGLFYRQSVESGFGCISDCV